MALVVIKKCLLWILVSWLILFSMAKGLRANAAMVSVLETMVGRTVSLPCLAIQHPSQPAPNLLLYYRTPSNIPFFSYDARSGDFWREGSQKISDPRFEDRLSLDLSEHRKASLNMKAANLKDGGQITCRVDFLGSPSQTSIIDLKVYANPKQGPKITIKDSTSPTRVITRAQIGPFYEGEKLNLSCTVVGGYPTPTVTWWQNDLLLDNSSVILGEKVRNDVKVGPLTRKLVKFPFKCRSENNPLTEASEKTVYIKIHMAPESVILPRSPTVSANIEESLECRAIGAYPEANISWTLDKRPLNFTSLETRQLESDTVSRVHFVAKPEDNGATISCTAVSPTLQLPPVSASSILNVTHAPIVWLRLGSNLKVNEIRQGADVYFDCETKANPALKRIRWYKNNQDVIHDKDKGIIVGGKNLVLQSVQRSDAGNYSCGASNSVGTTISRTLTLSVQYAPMCSQEKQVLTAVEGDILTLDCRVDAYPSNVTFSWMFNNTVDSTRFRKSEYKSEGAVSRLQYVAYTARDYGTIYCWAQNVVSQQNNPCSFKLQPAGAPDSVRDCVLTNQSAGSLHITCKPGADGGLTQSFRAQIFTSKSAEEPVRVLEGMRPVFTVEGLAPGGDYEVKVTAINKKGSSQPVCLEAFTLKVAENRMISGVSTSSNPEEAIDLVEENDISPLFGVIAGVVSVMAILSVFAIFATKRKCILRNRRSPDLVVGQELDSNVSQPTLSDLSHTAKHKSSLKQTQQIVQQHQEIVETDPFLQANLIENEVCSESQQGTSIDCSSGRPATSGVFTIPTNIPPPPQYCSGPCNKQQASTNKHHLQQQLCTSSVMSSPTSSILVMGGQNSPQSHSFPSQETYQQYPSPNYPPPTSSSHHHHHPIPHPSGNLQSPQQHSVSRPSVAHHSSGVRIASPLNSSMNYGKDGVAMMCREGSFEQEMCMQQQDDRLNSPVCYISPHPGVSVQYSSSEHLLEQSMMMSQSQKLASMGSMSPSSGTSCGTQDTMCGQSMGSPKGSKHIITWPEGHENSSFGYIVDEGPKEDCAL